MWTMYAHKKSFDDIKDEVKAMLAWSDRKGEKCAKKYQLKVT